MNAVDLRFTPDGKVESGNQSQPTLTLYNGAGSPQTVTLDFSQMTQYASGSTVTNVSDGNGFGNLASVSIDEQGRIIGSYTNDVKQVEGQVAIAQFSNASGLTKAGNSLYQQSNNSGTPKVGDNTTLGVGLTTSALEMSNVDIANEFSNMITTQRGFQSNSKIITVSDEMLETLINMKR
jgi:flagellar hook protein FlgE